MLDVTVKLTDQPVTIFGGTFGQIVDKGFDLLSAGFSQGGGATIVGGIGLHEASIEFVLPNQQAETVGEAKLAIMMAIVSVGGCGPLIR